ncbi:hypothetical protein LZD49_09755 [Dyadobacter sp. CY261]|uniref:hypothetical protein n=1 Tax=Dyadobacter sp. CY261 TaxID=2907203 RepID=UPI001F3DDB92|nr:hypothetical protein [Dyadobacter sp. CY261]MCF0070757.1 hypothetical protein [Dyadobacter sp. CY261]
MKKSIAIGIITGIVMFVFVISCGQRTQTGDQKDRKSDSADVAQKNKTEGYFYHQPEQGTGTDSSKIKKKVDN